MFLVRRSKKTVVLYCIVTSKYPAIVALSNEGAGTSRKKVVLPMFKWAFYLLSFIYFSFILFV